MLEKNWGNIVMTERDLHERGELAHLRDAVNWMVENMRQSDVAVNMAQYGLDERFDIPFLMMEKKLADSLAWELSSGEVLIRMHQDDSLEGISVGMMEYRKGKLRPTMLIHANQVRALPYGNADQLNDSWLCKGLIQLTGLCFVWNKGKERAKVYYPQGVIEYTSQIEETIWDLDQVGELILHNRQVNVGGNQTQGLGT